MERSFTFRDRVKFACLLRCIDAGLDEREMIAMFRDATRRLRSEPMKTAAFGWAAPTLSSLGYLALLGVPAAALGSAALGNIAGRTARNVSIGRLPSPEELKLIDEIATYHRTADEVRARTEDAQAERKRDAKPSVRRLL